MSGNSEGRKHSISNKGLILDDSRPHTLPLKSERVFVCIDSFLTSIGLNSTLHPISEFGGGGLNLIVCQFVDCMFCKAHEKNLSQSRYASIYKIKAKWTNNYCLSCFPRTAHQLHREMLPNWVAQLPKNYNVTTHPRSRYAVLSHAILFEDYIKDTRMCWDYAGLSIRDQFIQM